MWGQQYSVCKHMQMLYEYCYMHNCSDQMLRWHWAKNIEIQTLLHVQQRLQHSTIVTHLKLLSEYFIFAMTLDSSRGPLPFSKRYFLRCVNKYLKHGNVITNSAITHRSYHHLSSHHLPRKLLGVICNLLDSRIQCTILYSTIQRIPNSRASRGLYIAWSFTSNDIRAFKSIWTGCVRRRKFVWLVANRYSCLSEEIWWQKKWHIDWQK